MILFCLKSSIYRSLLLKSSFGTYNTWDVNRREHDTASQFNLSLSLRLHVMFVICGFCAITFLYNIYCLKLFHVLFISPACFHSSSLFLSQIYFIFGLTIINMLNKFLVKLKTNLKYFIKTCEFYKHIFIFLSSSRFLIFYLFPLSLDFVDCSIFFLNFQNKSTFHYEIRL